VLGPTEGSLEAEIHREIAQALGRSGTKVDLALLKLEVAAKEYEAATDPHHRAVIAERHRQLRAAAMQARLELKIHREAAGLRRNAIVDGIYPIPPPLPVAAAPSVVEGVDEGSTTRNRS
jgi:hypothetical protein